MSSAFDINTIASWATVAVTCGAGFGLYRKANKWFDSVDQRFKDVDKRFDEQAAKTEAIRTLAAETRTEVENRLGGIEGQMQPNGGKTHHDRMVAQVKQAVKEAVEDERRSPRRHGLFGSW